MIKMFENPLVRQYAVVITVNLCVLASGMGLVWPSPVLVKLSNSTQSVLTKPLTEEEGSWIVSIGFLTGIAANFLVAYIVDTAGRKYGLTLACLPKIAAGFVFIFGKEVWHLLLGRGLLGVADAAVFTIVPMYASEIASKEIRGSLGTILQILCSFGVVTMLSVGPFVSYETLNILFICVIGLTSLPLFFLPDSPYFLYSKGNNSEALEVLKYYRGSDYLANEEIKEYEMAKGSNEEIKKRDIITNRLFLKSMFLVIVLGLGLQLVGFNAVSFYLQTILESSQTSVRPEFASVVIGLIQLCASFGTTFMTDRFGRKPILTITCIGMAFGMFGLGIFFKLKENGPVTGFMNFVPLISLILIVYSYSAGFGSLYWVLSAELFDDKSRGLGVSITSVTGLLSIFILTKYFPLMTSAIGPAYTYWIFSVNCVLVCLFIMFCIPETKGRSFIEIQDLLAGNKIKKGGDSRIKC